MLNTVPCAICRDFQKSGGALLSNIAESETVTRGSERFFECPQCTRLYAVKAVVNPDKERRYAVVTANSGETQYYWMVDSPDGTRHRAKGKMTEEQANLKYKNPEKITHVTVVSPTT